MGARNVVVEGTSYNVAFRDGSCSTLFNGCDEVSDFFFTDLDRSHAANAALLEQVLLDTQAGQFDSDPGLMNGCGSSFVCYINTPLGVGAAGGQPSYVGASVRNRNLDALDVHTGYGSGFRDVDFTSQIDLTYALWSGEPSPVPIPGAVWLFGSALVGLLGLMRRRGGNTVMQV